MEIIEEIIFYRDCKGRRIKNYRTDAIILNIICYLPITFISEKHIIFIENSIKSLGYSGHIERKIGDTLMPKLIKYEKSKLVLLLLKILFRHKKTPSIFMKDRIDFDSFIKIHSFIDMLSKNKSGISELCGIDAAEIAIKKIEQILSINPHLFGVLTIPTIEDHFQTHSDDYSCQIAYFLRDMYAMNYNSYIEKKIRKLFHERHPIFKRIALYCINKHYNKLKDMFWSLEKNPLEDIDLKHEIYMLLEENSKSFNDKEIGKIVYWIECKGYDVWDDIKDDPIESERSRAVQKKEWLTALLPSENKKVNNLLKKYDEINPVHREHPGFTLWIDVKAGGESPVSVSEFQKWSNQKIAEYLLSYNPKGSYFDKDELANIFCSFVTKKPSKFSKDIDCFLDVGRVYQEALIRGLRDAWKENNDFDWDSVLNFVYEVIKPESHLWSEEYNPGFNYKHWIISAVSDLIAEGTAKDEHAFNEKLLPLAEKILLKLYDNTPSSVSEVKDVVQNTVNSPLGKLYRALIFISLRCARLQMKQEKEIIWQQSIKNIFNYNVRNISKRSLEFSSTIGQYFRHIIFLDEKWLKDNFIEIFPLQGNEPHWEAALSSYLFYAHTVFKELYLLFSKKGQYEKAITCDLKNDIDYLRLVEHIAIGYFEQWDGLEDKGSLTNQLLKNGSVKHLEKLVGFVWRVGENNPEETENKIKPLWRGLYTVVFKRRKDPDYKEVISKMIGWLNIIDKVDKDIVEWCTFSTKYLSYDRVSFHFIKGLLKHVENNPHEVGEMFVNMLEHHVDHYHMLDEIKKIVSVLYEKGEKENADMICNIFGENGSYFLRELFEKHNQEYLQE